MWRKIYYCSKFCQIVRVKTKNLRYCTIPQIWVTIPQIFREMAVVWNQKTEVLYNTVDFRKSTVLYNTAVFWFHNGAISRIFHNSGSTSPICKMFRFLEMALNFDGSFSLAGGCSMKTKAATADQICFCQYHNLKHVQKLQIHVCNFHGYKGMPLPRPKRWGIGISLPQSSY